MPFGRRRPLVRAAAVGTIGYQAGKRGAAAGQQQAEQQEPQVEEREPQANAPSDSLDPTVEKIKQLADLHASGALTDEEFAAAKAKALGIG
jgi:hypothetical protein